MADATHEQEPSRAHGAYEPPQPGASPAAERTPAYAAAGNRAFGQFIARMGAGLLPGGAVHPDVAAAIGAARGRGRRLPEVARARAERHLGDAFDDVRIHTDQHADDLARAVAARAFTTGTDVFFAAGEFQPTSRDGAELLTHELTHVTQQRGAPLTGPMTVSEPGDAIEHEAEQAARDAAH
jgi:hypothetical protein